MRMLGDPRYCPVLQCGAYAHDSGRIPLISIEIFGIGTACSDGVRNVRLSDGGDRASCRLETCNSAQMASSSLVDQ